MGPADTLSQKDEVDTGDDNREITLLHGKDQYFHIHTLNATLVDKISQSSSTDLIVSKALTAMNDEHREPWLPHTNKADWQFEDGKLYFKQRLYIPESAHHNLV